ncbi:MAG: hypothetical protein G01um101413_146 [Parcubacteria group bacterium Gr01-1014_13]|nr:MAG: hypothetical protein G01um101413_146 [Parcubacteria group bacterium Gr01-1014_13]
MTETNKRRRNRAAPVPAELGGVTSETTDRIEERLDKCFSKEDYATFQTEVKKITLEILGGDDGREKIKKHATEATKDYIRDEAWKNKTFWIPTVIAGIATIAAVIAIFK